jgi:putative transposase
MKYAFMETHEREFSVTRMCKVLGVRRSGYYAWKHHPLSLRAQDDAALLLQVKDAFEKNQRRYGSRRIQHYLRRKGTPCSRYRVAKLMKQGQLIALRTPKWHPMTTQQQEGNRIAPNVLDQDFHASRPNEKWVGDITYIATDEGWLYLASILDLYSRRVVGWAIEDGMEVSLVEKAWQMAFRNRHPAPDLLHHSDRGSQYTADAYLELLEKAHCQLSMSRTGNCYDNAAMESFHATLKGECAFQPFETKAAAKTAIFEFIEIWYNRQRLHSTLGYCCPDEFERDLGH